MGGDVGTSGLGWRDPASEQQRERERDHLQTTEADMDMDDGGRDDIGTMSEVRIKLCNRIQNRRLDERRQASHPSHPTQAVGSLTEHRITNVTTAITVVDSSILELFKLGREHLAHGGVVECAVVEEYRW